jgi:hypothetical protein
MQAIKYLASIAALTLFFSLGVFAKDANSGKFDLTQTAQIGSTTLQPGHYTAEWTGSNDALNVTILDHGKTVATAHGHLKQREEKAPYNAVVSHPASNNTQQVDEIDFDNRTEALVLGGI